MSYSAKTTTRKSRKLTPALLKRIIKEERRKLKLEAKKKKLTNLKENIVVAKSLKLEQKKALRHLRNILKARRLIKNKINREI